jgi:phage baseplate assembly protein V
MTAARVANHSRLQAALAAGKVGKPKGGLVTDYDPEAHAVKVLLQPEGIETGWLTISTAMAGPGYGVFAGPMNGVQAMVSFLEGDREVGWVTGFLPSDADAPPSVPAGEIWIVHKDGGFLKLTNDKAVRVNSTDKLIIVVEGDATLTVNGDLSATVQGDASLAIDGDVTSSANSWSHTGDVSVDGDIDSTGTITAATDVIGGGKHLKTHVHSGVTAGGGNTGAPV